MGFGAEQLLRPPRVVFRSCELGNRARCMLHARALLVALCLGGSRSESSMWALPKACRPTAHDEHACAARAVVRAMLEAAARSAARAAAGRAAGWTTARAGKGGDDGGENRS